MSKIKAQIQTVIKAASMALVLAMLCGFPAAQAEDLKTFNIPAQPLAEALIKFAEQTDIAVMAQGALVKGKQAPAVTGRMSAAQALTQLLQGSGLDHARQEDGSITISQAMGHEKPGTEAADKKAAHATSSVINEIIVTATKRETSIQDTAMSITAVGSEEIARRGLVGMGDYLNSVPGVSVQDQYAGRTNVVVRGLAINPQGDGFDGPLIGVYFGEIPVSGLSNLGSNPDIKLVDIERVEVLRGPQGTLYGSSSFSGTVRNVPVQPQLDEFQARINAGYSHTAKFGGGNSDFQGVINIPLVENELAVRMVGYRYNNSGFYKNIGAQDAAIASSVTTWGAVAIENDDVGSDEYIGGRVAALWKPTNKLTINLTYLNQDVDQEGWPSTDLNLGEGSYLQRRMQMRRAEGAPGYGEPKFNEGFSSNSDIANATVEYDFGWVTLLSSTSHFEGSNKWHRELGPIYFGFIPWSQPGSFDTDAFVEELRLTSSLNGPIQFIAGLYYEDIEMGTSNFGLFGGDPARNPFFDQVELVQNSSGILTKQKALFGELSYNITDEVTLTGGLRVFTYDRRDVQINEAGPFLVEAVTVSEGGGNDTNYKVGVEYKPVEGTLLYATWSQGFRLGRFVPDAAATAPLCDKDKDGFYDESGGVSISGRQLDPNFGDSYEVGGKFTLLDSRLQISANVYHVDWTDIPVGVSFGDTGCGTTLNAGEARSRGAELEGSYYISDDVQISFGTSYVDGELTKDADFIGVSGDRLPGSPKYNFNFGLQYEFSVADYASFIRTDYYYVGGFYNNLQESGLELGDYGMLNARAGIQFDHINLELFANNITNQNNLTWVDLEGSGNIGYHLRPRTVGLNIGYKF